MFFLYSLFCFYREDITINKGQPINKEINFPSVRLIGPEGEQLGIVSSKEANASAENFGLDLVLISPNANPPVCKIMDYGKFKFEQQKRLKEQRKAQKIVELKEVQLSMTIEQHDVEVKAKSARKFLQNGDKVKVTIRMKGRQQARPDVGVTIMNDFATGLIDVGAPEKAPQVMGKMIIMIMAPVKK